MPHQLEAIDFAMKRPSSLLWLKQGTGKTLIGLGIASKQDKTLIICPRSLVFNWKQEASKAFPDLKVGVFLSAMTNKSASKKLLEEYRNLKMCDVVVAGYESTLKLTLGKLKAFTCVIFDEVQRIKNHKSEHYKHLFKCLGKNPPKKMVGMSGTPFPNDVSEAWPIYRMLENDEFVFTDKYPSISAFRKKFQTLQRTQTVYTKRNQILQIPVYSGFINKTEYQKIFSPVTFRKEIDMGLGKLTEQDLRITAKISNALLENLKQGFFNDGYDLENFQTARRYSAISKAKAAAEYVMDGNEPAVVFSCYPEAIERTEKVLTEGGLKCVSLASEDDSRERSRKVKAFQDGEFDVIMGTQGVMSEGYTLTRAALVVLIDMDPRPKTNEQAIYRIYRKGQTKPCRAVFLSHSDVDSRIIEITTNKNRHIDKIEESM